MHTTGAKCRSEMIDRLDIHKVLYGCVAHLHRFEGLASGLVAGTRDCITLRCKQERDESKVGGSHVKQHI